ncbi:MAG: ATP-binding protein [Candidatus Sericytochromatia bacterium]|nr:ATP-binding protein [Candidatus Tanganyikabacteria bacterium]
MAVLARYLQEAIRGDALASGKMAFISGPRQVGKTTLGRALLLDPGNHFSWDDPRFRSAWSRSPLDAVASRGEGPILLDELHKDRQWKGRLKGLYDLRGDQVGIVVTGSARLDTYRRGGESLLGRYLPSRLHPFSVAERPAPPTPDEILEAREPSFPWEDIIRLGGFPEPLLAGSATKAQRWSRLRQERLVREDIRDIRNIGDLQAVRTLAELLPERACGLLSVNSLREDVGVAYATVRAWLAAFEALYLVFLVRPYSARVARALRLEPKLYLYDSLQLPAGRLAARQENLVALHLLKACHYWTDLAHGEFDLRYVRDKEKREVDFLVLRDRAPWMMVECKSDEMAPCPNLVRFGSALEVPVRIQLVTRPGCDKFFPESGVRVMHYERFLAGLV